MEAVSLCVIKDTGGEVVEAVSWPGQAQTGRAGPVRARQEEAGPGHCPASSFSVPACSCLARILLD